MWVVIGCSDPDGGIIALDEGRPGPLVPATGPSFDIALPDAAAPISPDEVDLGCPDGWFESSAYELPVRCHPWPTQLPADCGAWQAQFIGEVSCASVGTRCPSDGVPASLPPDAPVLYVQQGAVGGDGSRDLPYGTITAALAQASAGNIIAIGTGVYREQLVVPSGITLLGACVSQTVLTSDDSSTQGVITVAGTGVSVRNLRIDQSRRPAVVVGRDDEAYLDDVVVERIEGTAISVVGGTLRARTLLVRDGSGRPGSAEGLAVHDGGFVEVERGLFSGNAGDAVVASGEASEVHLTDVHVLGSRTFEHTDGSGDAERVDGRGVVAEDGAVVELRSFVSQACESEGVSASRGGTAVVEDALFLGERRGMSISNRGAARLRGVRIEGTRGAGILASGSDVQVEDVLIRGTRSEADGDHGRGIYVKNGGTTSLRRVRVEQSHTSGIYASQNSTLRVEDVTIVDVLGRAGSGEKGYGLAVDVGAEAALARVVIERARDAGFLVGPLGAVTVEDLVVRTTESQNVSGTGGHGIHVTFGSSMEANRIWVEGSRESGISVYGAESTAIFRDVLVESTRGRALDGEFGTGITVSAATVELDDAIVADNRHVGVQAGSGGTVSLRRVAVTNTSAQDCVSTETCVDQPFGIGIGAYQQASVEVSAFALTRSLLCGVQIAEAGNVLLENGSVSSSLIGACVQVEGFDMAGLTDQVVYRNNVRNLQSTSMPIPASAPPPIDPF